MAFSRPNPAPPRPWEQLPNEELTVKRGDAFPFMGPVLEQTLLLLLLALLVLVLLVLVLFVPLVLDLLLVLVVLLVLVLLVLHARLLKPQRSSPSRLRYAPFSRFSPLLRRPFPTPFPPSVSPLPRSCALFKLRN